MSNSKIDWTDKTWNPTTGCTMKCTYCYAEKMALRLQKMGQKKYRNGFAPTCHIGEVDKPLHWRKPARIFVNSMGDLFDPEIPLNFIEYVFSVMAEAPQHMFTVLTKNSERMAAIMSDWANSRRLRISKLAGLPNVWLGVTITRQEDIRRWWDLYYTCTCNRFISFEPLHGLVRFDCIHCHGTGGYDDNAQTPCPVCNGTGQSLDRLDWVICGGQTGAGAIPMHPDWVRGLRDACQAAGVPFFFKGWGEWAAFRPSMRGRWVPADGRGDFFPWPKRAKVLSHWEKGHPVPEWGKNSNLTLEANLCRVGKKRAGHLLNGREWREVPAI